MIKIGSATDFPEEGIYSIDALSTSLLIINHNGKLYCLENKCGHFGLSMEAGEIQDHTIVCPHHGISFSLITGEVVNRPYENCDALTVHELIEKEGDLFID